MSKFMDDKIKEASKAKIDRFEMYVGEEMWENIIDTWFAQFLYKNLCIYMFLDLLVNFIQVTQ